MYLMVKPLSKCYAILFGLVCIHSIYLLIDLSKVICCVINHQFISDNALGVSSQEVGLNVRIYLTLVVIMRMSENFLLIGSISIASMHMIKNNL